MYKAERALLNDCARTHTISHHLNNEKANSTLKLGEIKLFSVTNIASHLISVLIALRSIKTIQIDSSVERLQVFLIVGLSIKFEYFHVQLLYVLDDDFQGDIFVHSKQLFILFTELEHHFLLHLLKVVECNLVLVQRGQSILCQIALPASLDTFKILGANNLLVIME